MTKVNTSVQSGEEFDEFANRRLKKYGVCESCKRYCTGSFICHSCDPQISDKKWTSGSKEIDDFIREQQLEEEKNRKVIEWIPFDRLENIKKIGKGGFGTVYAATWIDGCRRQSLEREKNTKVALKGLTGTQKVSLDFLEELKAHVECQTFGSDMLRLYGVTCDPTKKEYMLVFQYADLGNLRQYVTKNFKTITWQQRLEFLFVIAYDLDHIHNAGYIHRDFHSGNILLITKIDSSGEDIESRIADLGLSRKQGNSTSKEVFGVLPFVAPEVLLGKPFTPASDIYGFGAIMYEISTGMLPFEKELDEINGFELSLRICNGLRPKFPEGTPECYVKLAKQCMDNDPTKRPTAKYLRDEIFTWWDQFGSENLQEHESKRVKEFLAADKITPTLTITSQISDAKCTSKLINTSKISKVFATIDMSDFTLPDSIEEDLFDASH